MKPLLLLLCLVFSSMLSAADDAVKIRGPENLRLHIEPAQVQVDRFLKFYDLGNFKAANNLEWKKTGLQQMSEYFEKKFGKFKGRSLHSIRVSDTYPPEADAVFIIFTYEASFENKKEFGQKVVVRLSEQGKYEISDFGSVR